jgi:hypothetical protein
VEEAYERKDLPGPGDEDRHLHRPARYPGMPSPFPSVLHQTDVVPGSLPRRP